MEGSHGGHERLEEDLAFCDRRLGVVALQEVEYVSTWRCVYARGMRVWKRRIMPTPRLSSLPKLGCVFGQCGGGVETAIYYPSRRCTKARSYLEFTTPEARLTDHAGSGRYCKLAAE